MSGWDQRGDIEDWEHDAKMDYETWAHQVEHEAARLQKTNKIMRWMYLIPAVLLMVTGIVVQRGFAIAISVFFLMLFAWNEHLIRKLKKAGIK